MPWLFHLSWEKTSRFGVLRSFEEKIFSYSGIQRTREYFVYFKDDGFAVGKKIPSKPCKSLWESAPGRHFFLLIELATQGLCRNGIRRIDRMHKPDNLGLCILNVI